MKSAVLILSNRDDVHALAVERHLLNSGEQPVFWTADDLLRNWHLDLSFSVERIACELTAAAGSSGEAGVNRINMLGLKSIWCRRPAHVQSPTLPEPWMQSLVKNECNRALEAMYRFLDCRWINPPAAEHNALFKLNQLVKARECGLQIPDTLVTNNPESARKFYDRWKGRVIYKLIDEASHMLFPIFESPSTLPTTLMHDSDFAHLDQVKYSLHLFQQFIQKTCDVRITVVGEKIFAAAIDSQKGEGKVDFRMDYSVPMSVHKLPGAVQDGILKLMNKLGLVFGAFDFCLDEQNNHYFLEVNPAGQWLWMEDSLGLPISAELARLLTAS